jgi:transposase
MNKSEREKRNAEIIDAYERGGHVSDIAKDFGVSVAVVYKAVAYAKEEGVITRTARSSRNSEEERQERAGMFIALYADGMSMREIGAAFGITGEAVRKAIRQGTGLSPEVRTGAYYSERRYESFASEHGKAIDDAFDETRNVQEVLKMFPFLSERHVRRYLAPKLKMSIQKRSSTSFWTQSKIVELLKAIAGDRERLSTGDYDKLRNSGFLYEGKVPPTKLAICWKFGTWNDAVTAAGLKAIPSKRHVYTRSWSRDEAMNAVRVYVQDSLETNRRPTAYGYEQWSPSKDGMPCRATLGYSSGGMKWSEMLQEAFATLDVKA